MPPLQEVKLEVRRARDLLLTLWVVVQQPDKTYLPLDLAGYTLEFRQKLAADATDPVTATYSTAGATPRIVLAVAPPWDQNGTPMTGRTERNRFTVQTLAANNIPAGIQWYNIDRLLGGLVESIFAGPFVVKDV